MFNFQAIPKDLRDRPQWVLANPQGAPCHSIGDKLIPIDPLTKGMYTFPDILILAEKHKCLIGFYLTEHDEFCCIDLDVKDADNCPDKPQLWTTKEQLDRYSAIFKAFDSYTEISRSGKGVHIWIKANIGAGARRDGVEVYSQERFIICTGRVSNPKPINERQELVEQLVSEMRENDESLKIKLVEVEPTQSDEDLLHTAVNASNGEKFTKLFYLGDWVALGYPSQSEADHALISMIAFYTQSNEQVRRLFLTSSLRRDKSTKAYIDRSLKIIRHRQEKDRIKQEKENAELQKSIEKAFEKTVPELVEGENWELDWPPGAVGELAKWIYNSSVRPVKEYSIATALGAMAGLVGLGWSLPRTGLNLYIIVVGASGTGKEVLHNGPAILSQKLDMVLPGVSKYFDFTSYVSAQALTKSILENKSFVNINGEFGQQLKKMADNNGNSTARQYRTALTHLYQKSGYESTLGGMSYSKKEESIDSASGVAYSMIGETTPGIFYDTLTEDMMEDGFMSRFNIIEYKGLRPASNKTVNIDMSDNLFNALCGIAKQSLENDSRFFSQRVEFDAASFNMSEEFDKFCDDEINKTDVDGIRQTYNRAHLKVIKVAAILAVADNWLKPVINVNHMQWALNLVKLDIRAYLAKFRGGAIGSDDNSRIKRVASVIFSYFNSTSHKPFNQKLKEMGIITKTDIHRKVSNLSNFRNHKMSANVAIDNTLKTMISLGFIAEVESSVKVEVNFKGTCYFVTKELFDFIAES